MITSLTIRKIAPVADSVPFGTAGPYVRIDATAIGAIDPRAVANRSIDALDMAPVNAQGRVEYEVDLCILRPAIAEKSNRRVIYEVVNRGRKLIFNYFCNAKAILSPSAHDEEFGDALLLERGFTIVWSGWDAGLVRSSATLAMTAPEALSLGRPVEQMIREEFVAGIRPGLPDVLRLSYEAVDTASSSARLSIRRRQQDPEIVFSPDQWKFADPRSVVVLPESSHPVPGALYDLRYRAKGAKISGIGFAATRDLISHLRHDASAEIIDSGIEHVLALGVSQAGRYLRDHVALGFNKDEAGRRVFDGIFSHAAGAGRVFCNALFAQPFRTRHRHRDHDFPEAVFPFSTATVCDPLTGCSGSILRGDDSDPFMIETNTSSEYWQKGASLLHTDPLGRQDLDLPDNTRLYLIAGTQHDGNPYVSADAPVCINAGNPHNPGPILRALLIALDRWVADGVAPPSSRIPTLADGSLRAAEQIGFPVLPGFATARECNDVTLLPSWVERTTSAARYGVLVCRVDPDGNEVAGIKTPDLAAPLGTHTGWNVFKPPLPIDALGDKFGSFLPFARDYGKRRETGDPRLSLAERYPDPSAYVECVRAAVGALLQDRLLLEADAAHYVVRAIRTVCEVRGKDLNPDKRKQAVMGKVYVRNGLFIGTVRDADRHQFEAGFRTMVLPRLREFPHLLDVRFMLSAEREDTAPDIYASLMMTFPSPETARTALESPARASASNELHKILPLFDGYITHVCYTADEQGWSPQGAA